MKLYYKTFVCQNALPRFKKFKLPETLYLTEATSVMPFIYKCCQWPLLSSAEALGNKLQSLQITNPE